MATGNKQQRVGVDDHSISAARITARFGETSLATGTAFIYRHVTGTYFITNWHNVTGRNPYTLELLDKAHAGIPDNIVAEFHSNPLGRQRNSTIPLYSTADEQSPNWLVHPRHRRSVDVVAIHVALPPEILCPPINDLDNAVDLQERVGEDVFVLGYPRGLSGGALLPIWKRGSIASEPMFDHDGLPRFLIDTATREGMSGAPVIVRSNSGAYKNTSGVSIMAMGGAGVAVPTKFIGIYSGRIPGAIDLEAQVGIVWKARVVDEIIAGGQRGNARDCEA